MKETVKDYETVEKNRELIYCDECGGECTDEHKIVPGHKCDECVDPPGQIYNSVEEARERLAELPEYHEETDGAFYTTVVCLPIALVIVQKREDQMDYGILAGLLGTLLWVVIPLLFYFLVIA